MSLHHPMKISYFKFFLISSLFFRGLTPLKLKNFDQKLKISNNTQNFTQIYSLESLINTSLHHSMKITYFNFFWISSLFFRGLTPLKLKNFDQKLKISNNTQNFTQIYSLESLINTSLHHSMKITYFNFFWISSLFFRGLPPLILKNLDQKLKISNNTQNFLQIYSLESLINTSLHHAMKITYFNFFWISSLFFRGLTPLKLKNFHQKLKISKNTIFFCTTFIMRMFNYCVPSSCHENKTFHIFLDFVTLFVG